MEPLVMPVIKKPSRGDHELVWLPIKEIVKIEIDKRNVVFHTLDEVYYPLSTLSDFEAHFYQYGFDLLDKSNLVNMEHIKSIDAEYGKVFFEEEPTNESKYAHIAAIQQKIRGQEINRKIMSNTNQTKEISIQANSERKLQAKLSTT